MGTQHSGYTKLKNSLHTNNSINITQIHIIHTYNNEVYKYTYIHLRINKQINNNTKLINDDI